MCQNFEDAVAKVFEAYNFFVRRQNLLFLHSYPSSGHLISRTSLDVFRYMKAFAYFWCEQGYKNEKLVTTKKIMQLFCKHQTLFFVVVQGAKKIGVTA